MCIEAIHPAVVELVTLPTLHQTVINFRRQDEAIETVLLFESEGIWGGTVIVRKVGAGEKCVDVTADSIGWHSSLSRKLKKESSERLVGGNWRIPVSEIRRSQCIETVRLETDCERTVKSPCVLGPRMRLERQVHRRYSPIIPALGTSAAEWSSVAGVVL